MAYIDALTEQEVTLRDFKSVLNRLMTNYNPKNRLRLPSKKTVNHVHFHQYRNVRAGAQTVRHLPLRKSRLKRWKNQKNRVLTWPLIRLILLKTHRFRLYTACMQILTAFGIYAFLTTVPVVKNGLTRRSNYLKNRRCI